jgi:dihydropyrimidinase
MVELVSTNPAKLFGLFPKKGVVEVGSDADLVVFDPGKSRILSAASQHSKCDYSVYEGIEVQGVPETVLVRGTPVILKGQLMVGPGHGQFLRRGAFRGVFHSPIVDQAAKRHMSQSPERADHEAQRKTERYPE